MVVLGRVLAWVWVVLASAGAGLAFVCWWRPSKFAVVKTWNGVTVDVRTRWWHVVEVKVVGLVFVALALFVLDGLVGLPAFVVEVSSAVMLAAAAVGFGLLGVAVVRTHEVNAGPLLPDAGGLASSAVASGFGSALRSSVRHAVAAVALSTRVGRVLAAVALWVLAALCAAGTVGVWTQDDATVEVSAPKMPWADAAAALDTWTYYVVWTFVAFVAGGVGMSELRENGVRSAWGWFAGSAGAVALMAAVHALS